jgi:hypothetical protein
MHNECAPFVHDRAYPGHFFARLIPQPKVEGPAPSGPGNPTLAVTAHRPPAKSSRAATM